MANITVYKAQRPVPAIPALVFDPMLTFTAAYLFVSVLFAVVGYITTARQRLHLGLCLAASLAWPISLLLVIAAVVAARVRCWPTRSRARKRAAAAVTARETLAPAENGFEAR